MTADLSALADRVEREEPSSKLWCDALYATMPLDLTEAIAKLNDGRETRFFALVKMGAYLDAAAMLMPEGWSIDITGGSEGFEVELWKPDANGELVAAEAEGPHAEARARLAAALRAHAVSN